MSQFTPQFEAALALNDAGQFDLALESYQAALELAQSGLALAQEPGLSTPERSTKATAQQRIGYVLQELGQPEQAIASLWLVSDGGTRVLMNAFYATLQAGYTKAEALQLAQQALIQGELEIQGTDERADFNLVTARTGLPNSVSNNLSHPFYWAPFILIGNGL